MALGVLVLALGAAALLLTRDDGDERGGTGVVPSVIGLTQPAAEAELVENGFSTQVVRREHAQPEGTVVGQRPAPGGSLDRGEVVVLTVSGSETTAAPGTTDGGTAEVAVPDVVGTHHILAGAAIDSTGLIADSVAVASGETCGRVLRQEPAPGTRLRRGEHVRLVVSLGPDPLPQTQVPGLSASAADARTAAREFGFTVRTVEERGGTPGEVARQVPTALTQARELTQITLYVGR